MAATKKGAKKSAKKSAKKFSAGGPRGGTTKVKASNVRGKKKHDGEKPIELLEKRLKRLNNLVKKRGGSHF